MELVKSFLALQDIVRTGGKNNPKLGDLERVIYELVTPIMDLAPRELVF